VSADGGTAPTWSHDGRELFYATTQSSGGEATLNKMMVVSVALRPTFTAGAPRVLFHFQGRYGMTAIIRGYDVTPDGRHFLVVHQQERPQVSVADMILIRNWFEKLKARVPTR
jgi:hypothetical protein